MLPGETIMYEDQHAIRFDRESSQLHVEEKLTDPAASYSHGKRTDQLPALKLEISSSADADNIDRLRKLAYSTATNFELPDPETVASRHDPAGSVCLTVRSAQQFAATVRLNSVNDHTMARKLLEGQAPDPDDFYPSLVVGRGATAPEFRGLGLMGFLVSMGVRVAELAGAPSAVAVQIAGTPHFRAMEAAGWTGTIVGQENLKVVDAQHDLMLVSIASARFGQNNKFSRDKYQALHQMLNPEPTLREAALKVRKALALKPG
jgi:hypothetical protein